MARSHAQKVRMKQVREGKFDPERMRSPYINRDLRTRKTKTKQDKLRQQKHKNDHLRYGDDGSFLLSTYIDKKVGHTNMA
ncbi:hypothetical protein FLK61_39680 [Paenalkalicoccus suaedae]|uniref:Uncharacterized protein n=1 Tax=Paenalkalicoccus suaedae TaxID=2592382 RepID=A0A859FHX3_9BACI|nr:hypothetical protein [Paenalkalicoccus suaedae]QKS72737.1 hypothetical protein FLK61_39680 [Paenalkalicoccus suaedae]